MKTCAIIGGLILIAGEHAFAQGTVWFSNKSGQVLDVPFFNDAGERLEGTNYLAQLYAGRSADALVTVGTPIPFMSGANSGYFQGGSVLVPFIPWRGEVWVQVRAWRAGGASAFETAALSGSWTGISSTLFLDSTGDPDGGGSPPFLPRLLIGLRYPGPPIIVRGPQDQGIRAGERAHLSVVGSGGVTLQYQWYEGQSGDKSQPAAGGTNANFTTPRLTTNSTFWVSLSTSAGATNSKAAAVTVHPANAALVSIQSAQQPTTVVIDGVPSTRYLIQFTADLNARSWIDIAEVTLQGNQFAFIDSSATNSSSRFYRAVVPEDRPLGNGNYLAQSH